MLNSLCFSQQQEEELSQARTELNKLRESETKLEQQVCYDVLRSRVFVFVVVVVPLDISWSPALSRP